MEAQRDPGPHSQHGDEATPLLVPALLFVLWSLMEGDV